MLSKSCGIQNFTSVFKMKQIKNCVLACAADYKFGLIFLKIPYILIVNTTFSAQWKLLNHASSTMNTYPHPGAFSNINIQLIIG